MTDKQKQRMEELAENHAVENRGYAFYNTYTEKYVAEHMKPIFKAGYEAALAEPCGGCEELVEALEFYASEIYHYYAPCNQDPEVLQDNGELAKEALSRYKKSHSERQAGDE